jgi:xylan 1,4-beta-xylosidase
MGLALHKEYLDELALVQSEVGFEHIRGHGLFCDDMAIYHENDKGNPEYNFTYLDRVYDSYLGLNIRPFIELGFMPYALAGGTQTIFYWKGNTTPPKDYGKWAELIHALLRHLIDRYGEAEVSAWPVEVWNEPNLSGFWENADKAEYFKLYSVSAQAVKSILPNMRVGGPAICGGEGSLDWIRDFLEFCLNHSVPLDFVTRHLYFGRQPETKGRYLYHEMNEPDQILREACDTRAIIDSFPAYRGMEMHITEFNTSYHPFCPTHDTNYNAALIAAVLGRLGDTCASYSYWTFGDVFEEQGVPDRPFHGGFGLVANGLIPKPTLWTFQFFKRLKGTPVLKSEDCVLVRNTDGSYHAVLWNLCREKRDKRRISLSLPAGNGEWVQIKKAVDEEACNPLKVWHELGEHTSPGKGELELLRECGSPQISSQTLFAKDGTLSLEVELNENAVIWLELIKVKREESFGYEYPSRPI